MSAAQISVPAAAPTLNNCVAAAVSRALTLSRPATRLATARRRTPRPAHPTAAAVFNHQIHNRPHKGTQPLPPLTCARIHAHQRAAGPGLGLQHVRRQGAPRDVTATSKHKGGRERGGEHWRQRERKLGGKVSMQEFGIQTRESMGGREDDPGKCRSSWVPCHGVTFVDASPPPFPERHH